MKDLWFETDWCNGIRYVVKLKNCEFYIYKQEDKKSNPITFLRKTINCNDAMNMVKLLYKTYSTGFKDGKLD
jgi:hypothetical protein